MKPVDFEYVAPTSLPDALRYLHQGGSGARILAGGQSLIQLLNLRVVRPELVVDITRLQELNSITERDGGVAIGAVVKQAKVKSEPLIQRLCPLLAEGLGWVGNPQTRLQGTLVGNLVHPNPAAEMPAVMVALGATLTVVHPTQGSRQIEAESFFGSDPLQRLAVGELVSEVWIPAQAEGSRWAFLEITRRSSHFALVGVAVLLSCFESGSISQVALALTGTATHPIRCRLAEDFLLGQSPSPDLFFRAGEAVATDPDVQFIDTLHATAEYRRRVTPVLVKRALMQACREGN